MDRKKRYVIITTAMLVGGLIGYISVSPSTYRVINSIPSTGINRQCDFNDLMCKSLRDREMYSGEDFSTTTMIDVNKTFQTQLINGLLGAVLLGSLTLGCINFISRKKP